jgi:hypothetical protein
VRTVGFEAGGEPVLVDHRLTISGFDGVMSLTRQPSHM